MIYAQLKKSQKHNNFYDNHIHLLLKVDPGNGKLICESNSFIESAISFANLSSCVNSSANFLIYMLRGKKFRDLFLETYCCKAPQYGGAGQSSRLNKGG